MFDSEIKITGKHATYIKFLAKKASDLNKNYHSSELFTRYIDVYIAGVTIGLVKMLKADSDSSTDETATIFDSAISREQIKLKMLYRMVQLLDNPDLSSDERIDLAFRFDADKEKTKKGMEIFNSYARGGIEWLYDEISSKASTKDEYLENLNNLVTEFAQDYLEAIPDLD